MLCKEAMVKKVTTVKRSATVETALSLLKKEATGIVPVIDDESGRVVGVFSKRSVLKEVLPVSVGKLLQSANDEYGDALPPRAQMVGATPGLSVRMQKILPQPVGAVMPGRFTSVNADTPLWEGINRLTEEGQSLVVVNRDGGLEGVISENSLLSLLEKK